MMIRIMLKPESNGWYHGVKYVDILLSSPIESCNVYIKTVIMSDDKLVTNIPFCNIFSYKNGCQYHMSMKSLMSEIWYFVKDRQK
jgi:hypothetical protein